jgi:hypothetical protein
MASDLDRFFGRKKGMENGYDIGTRNIRTQKIS